MRRLLLYVHYHKYNNVDEHVLYQLKQLKPIFDDVLFISNSKIDEYTTNKLKQSMLIDVFLQRKNIGFDFGAWSEGLTFIGWDNLKNYDSITLMNDTCYGPLWELLPYYEKYESKSIDFWGITKHPAIYEVGYEIKEHLQSYFMVFQGKVIESSDFSEFWMKLPNFQNVQEAIDSGEIYLTRYFSNRGYKYLSIDETYPLLSNTLGNNSIQNPELLLKYRIPFIKVKAFGHNPHLVYYLIEYIKHNTKYPVNLILKHQTQINFPTPYYLSFDKVLKKYPLVKRKKKIALVISNGVENETFYKILDKVISIKEEISVYLLNCDISPNLLNEKGIKTISINNSRSVWDIIDLLKYDIVGFFDIEKQETVIKQDEQYIILELLLDNLPSIIGNFENDPNLGVIFADLPSSQQTSISNLDYRNKLLKEWKYDTWKKSLDIEELQNIIVPPFLSFWMEKGLIINIIGRKLSPDFIIYASWANNKDFSVIPTHQQEPRILQIRDENVNFRRHTVKDIEQMSVSEICTFLFSPSILVCKLFVKKIIINLKKIKNTIYKGE